MAKIQETKSLPGKQAGEVYQAILQAVPKAGLEVWKRRDIAWLVMVRGGNGSAAVDGNVSARPGSQVTVALNAAGLSEEALRAQAETIFTHIVSALE
ncbi:MAG TPA: hypothetical protein VFF68_07770 [Anaerolineaceae bacterium]|nr:hypothetical protein [Anaerolineaceae bacterium]